MLRAIAYGNELNLAQPPRPTDPKLPWEPVWAVKVRVKSVGSTVVGMPSMGDMQRNARETAEPQQEAEAADKNEKKPGVFDVLRGVLGR